MLHARWEVKSEILTHRLKSLYFTPKPAFPTLFCLEIGKHINIQLDDLCFTVFGYKKARLLLATKKKGAGEIYGK